MRVICKNCWAKVLVLVALSGKILGQDDALLAVGQTKLAELQMKLYPKDSTSAGVVLQDRGTCSLIKDDSRGYMVIYRRYTRVKIFKKSAFDYANIEIPFYGSDSDEREKVRDVRARTYNLNNDKIEFSTLDEKAIFEEKKTSKVNIFKFALPNVREGSVIEYSYAIESDLVFQLRDWEFQTGLPVLRSDFWLTLIPNFEYRILFQGISKFDTDETSQYGTDMKYHWGLEHIPTLRNEPYITTLEDYRVKIWFELVLTNLAGTKRKYTQLWEDIDRSLANETNFGLALNKSGFLKEIAQKLNATQSDTLTRAKSAYDWVRLGVNWNNQNNLWVSKSLKDTYENRTGTSADINLLLVALLREMKLDANPVILSTRSNGKLNKDFPLLSKFNYVVAHLSLNGQDVLLDATDQQRRFGMLPLDCLSQEGRLVAGRKSRWVSIKSADRRNKFITINAELTSNGQLKGQVINSMDGYVALDERKQIVVLGIDSYRAKLTKEDGVIDKVEITNADQNNQRLVVSYNCVIGEERQTDRFYVNPLIEGRIEINPFKEMIRMFPVDLGVAVEELVTVSLAVPTGFVVEELPKNLVISLPKNAGRFLYEARYEGNMVLITSRVLIRNTYFLTDQYDALRAFYDQVIAKHGELVVFAKK